MLKQKARVIARIVYGVDLALTSVAFFAAFFIRDALLPWYDPAHFPTGLYPIADYLKIYPLVLIIWSVLLFTYDSYHSHRTIPLTREAITTIRVVVTGTDCGAGRNSSTPTPDGRQTGYVTMQPTAFLALFEGGGSRWLSTRHVSVSSWG